MAKKLADIDSQEWQPRLGALGEVVEGIDDIGQCIRVILSTPLRSDPHRPEFGVDLMPYIDLPATVAVPGLIRAAWRAVERWEKRAVIEEINAEVEGERVRFRVRWSVASSQGSFETEAFA